MCYMLRHSHTTSQAAEDVTEPASGNLRPRLVGAVAAMLFGGLALAAFVSPQSPPPPATTVKQSAPAPVDASPSTMLPVAASQRSLPVDDEVPTKTTQSAADHCHHGL